MFWLITVDELADGLLHRSHNLSGLKKYKDVALPFFVGPMRAGAEGVQKVPL